MNQFKALDQIFPCLPNRHAGEVVSVSVHLSIADMNFGVASWKRKAWYVNASTNAFILHRKLCGEMTECLDRFIPGPYACPQPTPQQVRKAKKLLAIAVWNSYVYNALYGDQYTEWHVVFPHPETLMSRNPSLWWNTAHADGTSVGTNWVESCARWEYPEKLVNPTDIEWEILDR
jgi:hypothetical protein